VIIGAGCVGSAIARELSKTQSSVLLLEAADDVTQGATKGNSGIVHAGFDDKPGTNRAKYCWPGNQMFSDLDEELHFGYQKNGSLVLATSPAEEEHLKELKKRGETNGVKNLRIIQKKELFEMEPYVNPKCTAALHSPDAGNLIPYEYTIALAENAVDNGVELRIRRQVESISKPDGDDGLYEISVRHWEPQDYLDSMLVASVLPFATFSVAILGVGLWYTGEVIASHVDLQLDQVHMIGSAFLAVFFGAIIKGLSVSPAAGIEIAIKDFVKAVASAGDSVGEGGSKVTVDEMKYGGSGSSTAMKGATVEIETVRCKYIVNAAGSFSDKIANMIGDNSFKIKPRLGDYMLLNRNQGHLSTHTLFPCPGPLGKGVLVQTTLWGNLILGPTARDVHLPEVMAQTVEQVQEFIFSKCKNLVPSFDARETIHSFCGARAKSDRGDWIIESSAADPTGRFIHAAGIDSPGLAGSPAIALEIVRLLGMNGLETKPDPKFNPNRAPIITPKVDWKGIQAGPVGKVTDPARNIVCKCEKVTEAEIVRALRRNLPIDSTQAIRKRTRAGMGHCQGEKENYNCECRVAAIVARENKTPVPAITRRPWPATSSLPQRWMTEEEKDELKVLQSQDTKLVM
jgi:L-2-hydroxyglutarate oxidase LhgO